MQKTTNNVNCKIHHTILDFHSGANDAVVEQVAQYVSLIEFTENISKMIRILKSGSHAQIVLVTPPPVDEALLTEYNIKKGKTVTTDRSNENTYTYALAVKDIAKKYNLPVVDLWNVLKGDTVERVRFLSDGLHLNEIGNSVLYDELTRVIIEAFPNDFDPVTMKTDHPHWSQYTNV